MNNVPDDQVKVTFLCTVEGCGYDQPCKEWLDVYRYDVDKSHMIGHYKWEHADLFGKKVYGEGDQAWYWRYEYGPIPDKIQPVIVYQEFDTDGGLISETVTKFNNDLA